MTITQLRTFLAIAETGSVRTAAEQLFVTQSAVSASLANLQLSLGIRLFGRNGRGLRLTKAGEIYAEYVRSALGLLDEGQRAAATEDDPEHGQLRIAALTTAGEQILPGVLAGFRLRYPQLGVLLEVGNRSRVRALYDHHEVDLVLGGRPAPGQDIRVHAVRPYELIVVAPPRLAQEAAAQAPIPWLARQTWLLREHGSGTRATTEAFLSDLDLAPRTLTVGSNVAVRESVAAGLGVTLISRDAVIRELAAGRLAEIPAPTTPIHQDWYLAAHPGRLLATAALLVAHVLETEQFHRPSADPVAGDAL